MPEATQPKWKIIANLGDANPIDYGGVFVLIDETGNYPPECELLEAPPECAEFWNDETGDYSDSARWQVHRFILENCTFENGILSDNQFHPDTPAWFAKPERERAARPQDTTYLADLAEFGGRTAEQLAAEFCATDPTTRAGAWLLVAQYHGADNLDNYPLELNAAEVRARYPEYS